jgi:H+/Cl- antiporter ClcA
MLWGDRARNTIERPRVLLYNLACAVFHGHFNHNLFAGAGGFKHRDAQAEVIAMQQHEHHLKAGFEKELTDWRTWLTRTLVVLFAALSGLVVVAFTWLSEHALGLFSSMRELAWWSPLLWTPLCAAVIVWLTRRYVAGAGGSGIPQVMATLDPSVPVEHRSLFVSLKLSAAKIFLTSWGLLAGLSLGREGPSVQVAAGVMLSVRRWLPKNAAVSDHGLLVAGGAAGIAAAFNTPLAGVMFAIEELSRTPEQRNSGLIMSCIVLAGLIAVSLDGNATYFGVIRARAIDFSLILPGMVVAVCCGLAGGLFSRLMVHSLNGNARDRWSRLRLRRPVLFAAGCGLAVAVIGVVSNGDTFGSGSVYTRQLVEGSAAESSVSAVSSVFFFLKFIATWLTAWSGVPAGIFAPSLSIGAALGNDIALLMDFPHAPTLIALGMAGFLAAATQAPLTSFIIVMEMVDGHAMVLSLMACALVSSTISRIMSPPLYATLAGVQLERLPAAAVIAAPAPAAPTSTSS